ncbi:ESPR-type extended signal peptide-containing protein, partial [Veillonella tobetsuensis]|uniref:ESPR-type extended signal peptide-containing protein n=1 Tax=Veillonella tobetsuensis TaxID=1110546 RepID=UPI000A7DD949
MGLNHIYKVIWSKTKNAWVVVSEIAKRDGKSSVKSVVTSLAGKSVAAVMVAMVMCGGVASANTQYGVGADGGFNGTAIGENAKANSHESTVIGMNAKADGNGVGSIVIGTNAYGMGYNASPNSVIAIGYGARANTGSGGPTMAIGEAAQAEATAGNAMAIGYNSKALGYNGGIAIGSDNTVYGNNLVLGRNSQINQINGADPTYAISIGNINRMDGNEGSLVIGNQNHLMDNSGTFSNRDNILIGSSTKLNGTDNTVIGSRYTNITGNYITAIGDVKRNATNWSNDQVVIGHYSAPEAVASVSNSIGIGGTGKTLALGTFAGSNPFSVVSFGDSSTGSYTRQLKNVAPGVISPFSTDAINGSQLYRTIEALYSLGSPDVYMHVNDGTSTQGAGNATTNLGKANEKGGATGTKSIAIGMNASAKKDVGVALGNESVANDEGSVAIGSSYSKSASGVVSYSGANATGKNAISILGRTSGDNAIGIGYNASPARNAIVICTHFPGHILFTSLNTWMLPCILQEASILF